MSERRVVDPLVEQSGGESEGRRERNVKVHEMAAKKNQDNDGSGVLSKEVARDF